MRVAIVGCGVGGMASAIALRRDGHDVVLFEAFETPRPLGSGLLLQPSGLKALEFLGLKDRALAAGARISGLDGRDQNGRRILQLDYEAWRKETYGLGIQRADLFSILYDAAREAGIEIRTGSPVTAIQNFDRPALETGDGQISADFDIVVVADGSGSTLREHIRPKARAPVYPWGAVWANCKDPTVKFSGVLEQRYHGCDRMIGVLPTGGGTVSFFWSLPLEQQDDFFRADFDAWKQEVLRLWPQVKPLIGQMTGPDIFARATYRDVSVGNWRRGACVLIGDAAHGTSPQLGQGANLALLDAVELPLHLTRSPARSLARFQSARRRQTSLYQLVSRALTPMFQSSSRFWLAVRNWVFSPAIKLPIARWFVAGGLTGTARLGVTPKRVRV